MEASSKAAPAYRIDLARAWRHPPAAATPYTLGTTTGMFFAIGGLDVLLAVRLFDLGAHRAGLSILGLAALLTGAFCYGLRALLPRWFYFVAPLFGTALISASVLMAPSHVAALALSMHYFFVVVDCGFYYSLRTGLIQFAVMMASAAWCLLRLHVPGGALVFLFGACIALLLVVTWISRMTDATEEDALTGLLNLRGLEQRLQETMRHAREHELPLCVAVFDLDGFKQVNDANGHQHGDHLLVECADTWRSRLPAALHLGRYGGDEFVLILPGHSLGAAAEIVDALRENTPGITASAGLAAWMRGDSASVLLSRADSALYEAKSHGRNRTIVHGDPDRMARELEHATETGQLRLHYQPVVRLDTGATDGYEALLRWQHPRRGLIDPSDFIPQAEHNGAIHAIGQWALEQACIDLASGRLQPAMTSINVSVHELRRCDYAARATECLDRHRLPGEALIVEVTESVFGDDDAQLLATLHALRARGVRVAIDDFGAGYSSLRRIQSLPIDFIKLDGSMTRMIAADSDDAPILEVLSTMGEHLQVKLVAEWVETEHQAAVLRRLGYQFAQGWLFGQPAPLP